MSAVSLGWTVATNLPIRINTLEITFQILRINAAHHCRSSKVSYESHREDNVICRLSNLTRLSIGRPIDVHWMIVKFAMMLNLSSKPLSFRWCCIYLLNSRLRFTLFANKLMLVNLTKMLSCIFICDQNSFVFKN